MMMKEVLFLILMALMLMPGYTRKPPDYDYRDDDATDILQRPSSQGTQKHLKTLRNYIFHSPWRPSGQELSRQLRNHPMKDRFKKAKNKVANVLKLKKPKLTEENGQTQNDSADLTDNASSSIESFHSAFGDLSSVDSKIPSFLIDVALEYYRENFNDTMYLPEPSPWPFISPCLISGLHKIQRIGLAGLVLEEWSATFKLNLVLALNVKCPCSINKIMSEYDKFHRTASLSAMIQLIPVQPDLPNPSYIVDAFKIEMSLKVPKSGKVAWWKRLGKCLNNFIVDKLDEMIEDAIKSEAHKFLNVLFNNTQEYSGNNLQ